MIEISNFNLIDDKEILSEIQDKMFKVGSIAGENVNSTIGLDTGSLRNSLETQVKTTKNDISFINQWGDDRVVNYAIYHFAYGDFIEKDLKKNKSQYDRIINE